MDPAIAVGGQGSALTVAFAVISVLTGAVSVLFGILNSRMSAQLAAAEKRASDAEARDAASQRQLADERKERFEHSEALRAEVSESRDELLAILADQRSLARAQARGSVRERRPSRPDLPGAQIDERESGARPVRRR